MIGLLFFCFEIADDWGERVFGFGGFCFKIAADAGADAAGFGGHNRNLFRRPHFCQRWHRILVSILGRRTKPVSGRSSRSSRGLRTTFSLVCFRLSFLANWGG